ncbi:cytochrome P450 [Polyporus arcularius HHB13444]|uniref:Cytochrome P450 n=1 Tax=Polyporus arcularius HHB13444 TaxID=1314778 RepID=A0A5C3PAA9_9APHY|nr:cytochrome P450 [Polyporus arcularius HHB13444]
MQTIAVFVLSSVLWLLWRYFRQVLFKSPLDNLPGPPAQSFLSGNLKQLIDFREGWNFLRTLTDSYPGIAKLNGPLGHRMLFVFDPLALHNIIVKDQYVYEEAAWFIRSNRMVLGPGLLGTLGEHHRKQRKLLNPVFSTGHMRRMIPIFYQVGHKLADAIEKEVGVGSAAVEIDLLSWMGRAALEMIGQAGLGYSFDPLVAEAPDDFATAIKSFAPAVAGINFWRRLLPYLPEWGSPALRRKIVESIPHEGVQKAKSVVDTIHRRSVEIYEEKKRALEEGDEKVTRQIGEGKDIMSILMRANMAASEEDKLPEHELTAQMSTFIFAGMDTTSNALAIIFSLLAEHPDVQSKLRHEILEASNGEDLDHDTLVSLPYLDAVCRETLRLHAPVATMFREARQDIILPLSKPVRGVDGAMISEVVVPKDTTIAVGLLAANTNRAIWGEDALEWKPERWLSPLPENVTAAKIPGVYSNLMTFLGGGRACIGFKFSQLEIKIIICLLLAKFTFAPSETPIFWNLATVRYPTAGGGTKASLPIKVALYRA